MSKFNSNNKFDVKKWLDFMNTAISNIDETLSTQILDNSLAYKNNIAILTDEVYKDLYFEGGHNSVFDFDDMEKQTVILDGFCKSYAMTGWRL
ncbi:MAG: hypothetical protein CL498_00005, partial [Actinobacteria bacterium]|nr:hypothetical protein [Actinomycetota bacterium]